jgi:hypothetical protein
MREKYCVVIFRAALELEKSTGLVELRLSLMAER